MNEIRIEVTVAAPPEVVWQALSDPELIRRWHGWELDSLDEEIGIIYGTAAYDRDALTVSMGDGDRFTLHPADAGTTVRITRAPKGNNPEWDEWYDDVTQGWRIFLAQLKFGIENHSLAPRRTIFLEGRAEQPIAAVLGIGAPGRLELPTGDIVDTRATFVSDDVAGLVVAQWGPGLLVYGDQPRNANRPDGGAMVLITTYGLADHDELAQRWTDWWSATAAPADARSA